MLIPRVTMQHVARAAKVHQTTVSMALRNDPRLPERTRARIRRIADRLGYKPDPMLSALNYYRSSRSAAKISTTMALLLDHRDSNELNTSHAAYAHRLFLDGARNQADQFGYHLEVFYLGPDAKGTGARVERILLARGIVGIIIGAFDSKMAGFQLHWDNFCITSIESLHLGLPVHRVMSHHMMITKDAVWQLQALGYRNIGLAVGEHEEGYLGNAFTAGYYAEIAQHAGLVSLPPLLLPNGSSTQEIAPVIAKWVNANEIEVIISNWPNIPDAIRVADRKIRRPVMAGSLDLNPHYGPNAGIEQNHRIVGERAIEQLALLMRKNQRGLIESPNNIMIQGRWVSGTNLPERHQAAKRRR